MSQRQGRLGIARDEDLLDGRDAGLMLGNNCTDFAIDYLQAAGQRAAAKVDAPAADFHQASTALFHHAVAGVARTRIDA